jgi:transcriptional regulator with XRE-family HTH domain
MWPGSLKESEGAVLSQVPEWADPPEVLKRRLRAILRQERERLKWTQKTAAERVLWSESKLIRIETGNVAVAPADVRLLLLEYGVEDARIAEYVDLARAARQPDEWADYKEEYSQEALTLFANERSAKLIQSYEPTLIPGLFQTEAYARSLLTALGTPPAQLKRKLGVRLRRQEILDSEDRPDCDIVIGEAAVSRPIGGKRAMLVEQIEHLKKLAEKENITLQLIPFDKGAHAGIGRAFTILQFRDPQLPDLLYLEDADSESIERDQSTKITRYGDRFVDLKELSISGEDLNAAFDEIARYRFGGE